MGRIGSQLLIYGLDWIWLSPRFQTVNTNDLSGFYTGHSYKLHRNRTAEIYSPLFFCERVINVWNKLPAEKELYSLSKFKRTITSMDFSDYLLYF